MHEAPRASICQMPPPVRSRAVPVLATFRVDSADFCLLILDIAQSLESLGEDPENPPRLPRLYDFVGAADCANSTFLECVQPGTPRPLASLWYFPDLGIGIIARMAFYCSPHPPGLFCRRDPGHSARAPSGRISGASPFVQLFYFRT